MSSIRGGGGAFDGVRSYFYSLKQSFDDLPTYGKVAVVGGVAIVTVPLVRYLWQPKPRTELITKEWKQGMYFTATLGAALNRSY